MHNLSRSYPRTRGPQRERKALIAASRTRVLARWLTPSAPTDRGGYGSPPAGDDAECGAFAPQRAVILRASGVSSTPWPLDSIISVAGILDRPPSRAMTVLGHTSAFPRRRLRPRCARIIRPCKTHR